MQTALLIIVGVLGVINLVGGAINTTVTDGFGWRHYSLAVGGLIIGVVGTTVVS